MWAADLVRQASCRGHVGVCPRSSGRRRASCPPSPALKHTKAREIIGCKAHLSGCSLEAPVRCGAARSAVYGGGGGVAVRRVCPTPDLPNPDKTLRGLLCPSQLETCRCFSAQAALESRPRLLAV